METIREFETLRGMGVTLAQGYLLGRPAAAETWRLAAGDGPRRAVADDPEDAPAQPAWGLLPFAS